MTKRPRIRRPRTVRIVVLKPGDPAPPRRTNPHGWRFANQTGDAEVGEKPQRWLSAGSRLGLYFLGIAG